MKNRKAKRLFLQRPVRVVELVIIIVIQCDDGTVTVVNVRNDRVAVCRKGEPCKEIKL
ncbi:TPA: hypothetical protein NY310_004447 [Escherichia coli]|nr:hypothetical protein [Escherichia coli]HCK1932033.1 hypothetical protein [Escherichia coli]